MRDLSRSALEVRVPEGAFVIESAPIRSRDDPVLARLLLALAPSPRTPVSGGATSSARGEMWNSDSIIAWLIVRSGLDADAIHPSQAAAPPDGTPARRSRAGRRRPSRPRRDGRGREGSPG